MRTQAEPADQRALELVVRHGLCAEGGAVEIADALSGIGDDLANDLALNGIGAMPARTYVSIGLTATAATFTSTCESPAVGFGSSP